jgi:hypothetical protein
MCSSSLIYLLDLLLGEVMEEVMGGLVDCQNSFWTFTRFVGKWQGAIQPASSLSLPLRSYCTIPVP